MGIWKTRIPIAIQLARTALEVSDGNKDSARNRSKDNLNYSMAKNLCLFFQCPDNLSEAQIKGNGPPYLAEGIARQCSIKAAGCF